MEALFGTKDPCLGEDPRHGDFGYNGEPICERKLMKYLLLETLGLVLAATVLWAFAWTPATPDFQWSFPADHWAHPAYRTEWWYLTGHLEVEEEPSRLFGFQFTFFRIGLLEEPPKIDSDWATRGLIMGHAAVTDISAQKHVFSELLYREGPLLGEFSTYPGPRIAWSRGPVGTPEAWSLVWNGEAFDFSMCDERQDMGFELKTRPSKPLVFQGPNGYSRKGANRGSLYYSFTRLTTEGTLRLGGRSWKVRGESWMDKEFGSSQLGADQVGWDWFSLQLGDGRDLMLYLLRREDGTVDSGHATLVESDGTVRFLSEGEWGVDVTDSWTSTETAADYPARWTVNVPSEGLRLDVVPVLDDQENRSRLPGGVFYWEGAVRILDPGGNSLGRGYVELTGYGEGNKPPI
jgi:predicted secreted hydrolase